MEVAMRTILVPLDGSLLAEGVYPSARLLALAFGARLKLLRAIPPVEPDPLAIERAESKQGALRLRVSDRSTVDELQGRLRTQAESYLRTQALEFRSDGLAVEIEAVAGRPDEVIAQVASELEDPIIVMATHGYGGVRRWVIGSVTDRVLHTVSCPVLVVRPGDEARPQGSSIRRIMVPLDGSPLARRALPLAAEVASRVGASELMLLTVVKPITVQYAYDGDSAPLSAEAVSAGLIAESAGVADELASHGVALRPLVVDGLPAEALVDAATKHQVDLVVMATHGGSGVRRWALGSVADKVIHATTTPVLLVPVRKTAG
jgi:nucleotide-binding universal stress UspA family protein